MDRGLSSLRGCHLQTQQKIQRRALGLCRFFLDETKTRGAAVSDTANINAIKDYLKEKEWRKGKIGYSNRTINLTIAHLKTFAKWIHKLKLFPLGNPMAKLKLMPFGTGLEVERAITPAERRRILDAADSLPLVGGRSRYRNQDAVVHKGIARSATDPSSMLRSKPAYVGPRSETFG